MMLWINITSHLILEVRALQTSMHSSRMRTAHLLPVSPNMHCCRMWTEFLTHASENTTLPNFVAGGKNANITNFVY